MSSSAVHTSQINKDLGIGNTDVKVVVIDPNASYVSYLRSLHRIAKATRGSVTSPTLARVPGTGRARSPTPPPPTSVVRRSTPPSHRLQMMVAPPPVSAATATPPSTPPRVVPSPARVAPNAPARRPMRVGD